MINYSTNIQFRIDPLAFTNCTAKGNICFTLTEEQENIPQKVFFNILVLTLAS